MTDDPQRRQAKWKPTAQPPPPPPVDPARKVPVEPELDLPPADNDFPDVPDEELAQLYLPVADPPHRRPVPPVVDEARVELDDARRRMDRIERRLSRIEKLVTHVGNAVQGVGQAANETKQQARLANRWAGSALTWTIFIFLLLLVTTAMVLGGCLMLDEIRSAY